MTAATFSYSPVMTGQIDSVIHVISRISRYRIRQEFYPIFGVIGGFISMAAAYAVG
jgi:hypothetical protein